MSDGVESFLEEIEEDIRREKLHKIWARHGNLLIGIVVLIILATAAMGGWQEWHRRQEEKAATALFTALGLDESGLSPKQAADRLSAMADQFNGTQQATVARMMEAGLRLRSGDRASAIRLYDSISRNGETAAVFRDMATLFSVELQLDTADPLELQQRLDRLQSPGNAWRFSAWEFGSILAGRRGDPQAARMMLEKIIADPDAPKGTLARAQEMLRTYSVSAPPKL